MSKGQMTLNDLIEHVEISMQSGTITNDYTELLGYCREMGLSSYVLNVLIQKAKYANDEDSKLFDSSFFFSTSTEPIMVENKVIQTQYVYVKKWGWKTYTLFFIMLVLIIIMAFAMIYIVDEYPNLRIQVEKLISI